MNNKTRSWGAALLVAVVALSTLPFGGCYYVQAVNGQLELLRKREPIAEVLADPGLNEATERQLRLALAARQFAVDELKLPDNDSYRSYADLGRDFVVWNVFAAHEFSLAPKTWCFPVVGCVAYRGYFSEAAARRHADKLEQQGFDVHVGGVPAYSTLGRFDDPVLNTMLRWSDIDLVATLFHELAHQQLFVKGDTAFNESFATAVAEVGLARWLTEQGRESDIEIYRARDRLRETYSGIAAETRTQLAELYAADLPVAEKRARKQALLSALTERAEEVAAPLGLRAPAWLQPPLNNARLLSVALYRGHVEAFRKLFLQCGGDFECLYAAVEDLAELNGDARAARLRELAAS